MGISVQPQFLCKPPLIIYEGAMILQRTALRKPPFTVNEGALLLKRKALISHPKSLHILQHRRSHPQICPPIYYRTTYPVHLHL
jgi:hypothetical protein